MRKLISLKYKSKFVLKNSCFSIWSCKNSHIVETEQTRPFILYLIDFLVVLQLYLSVAEI